MPPASVSDVRPATWAPVRDPLNVRFVLGVTGAPTSSPTIPFVVIWTISVSVDRLSAPTRAAVVAPIVS